MPLADPLADVRSAIQQLDTTRFAGDEEAHDRGVHQRHLVQVEHQPRAVLPDLGLELIQVLRLDAAAEPERRGLAVGGRFDLQGHLRDSLALRGGTDGHHWNRMRQLGCRRR